MSEIGYKDLKDYRPIHVLTALLMAEARGEPYDGRVSVAFVVRNRVRDRRWPNTYAEVITQPYQFSCLLDRDPNQKVFLDNLLPSKNFNLESMIYRECLGIAFLVIGNWRKDITQGANHYHADWMVPFPKWSDPNKITYSVGGHIFYKL
ncbi:MAG: cell wall hydrolase [Gammaproteobacteria bacterium]|nr:cell wall hydrolase [Gammaproteobacteria bacterium]